MYLHQQNRRRSFQAVFLCLVLLCQVVLISPAVGVLVGVDGNQFVSINASDSNKTILCTSISQSHCDTDHSVVIGRNNYDNGAVAARFEFEVPKAQCMDCLLYTSPSPRDRTRSRMPSSA